VDHLLIKAPIVESYPNQVQLTRKSELMAFISEFRVVLALSLSFPASSAMQWSLTGATPMVTGGNC